MSNVNSSYEVQIEWTTVVPLGDTLAVKTNEGFDDRWVKAFQVVLDEHERRSSRLEWDAIEFDHSSNGKDARFALFVKRVAPGAKAPEVRRTLNDLVKTANKVAVTGPHVYELAAELREPEPSGPRQSAAPPPTGEQVAAELSAAS